MGWFDSIGAGLGHVADMFTGSPGGTAAAGMQALSSSAVGQGLHNAADNTDFGKATGLGPYLSMLGIGAKPAESKPATVDTPFGPRPAAPNPDASGPIEFLKDPQAVPLTARERADVEERGLGGIRTAGNDFVVNSSGSGGITGQVIKAGDEGSSTNYFGKKNADGSYTGGFNLPTRANWDAVGIGGGNRQSDMVGRIDPATGKETEAIKVGAPDVWQPDLSKIPRTYEGQKAEGVGAGSFAEHAYGSYSDVDDIMKDPKKGLSLTTKFNPGTGKGSTSIFSMGGQAGVEEKGGYRAHAESDDYDKHGGGRANAEAGYVANAGASYAVGLDTENGAYATAGVGAKSGLYASADADAKTDSIKIGGQEYDAGIGVHGDTFLGAKAGASGTIGLGPDFIGAKGSAGAFVGAEAAGDIHGNLGPLGAKLGASGMVGAGVGADGDVSYKDGKFHIGGKLFACLGYGGSISGDVTIDFGKIAKSMGPLGEGVLDIAAGGIGGALQMAGGVLGGAYDLGAGVVEGLGDIGGGAISGIGEVLGGVGEGVGDAASGMAKGAGEAVGGLLDGAGDVAGGIGRGFSDFADGDILGGLGDIGGGMLSGAADVGGGLVHGAADVLGGIGSGVADVGGGLVRGAGDVLGGLGSGALAIGGGIVNGVGDVAGGIANGAGSVLSGVGSGLSTIGGGIVSGIGSLLSW